MGLVTNRGTRSRTLREFAPASRPPPAFPARRNRGAVPQPRKVQEHGLRQPLGDAAAALRRGHRVEAPRQDQGGDVGRKGSVGRPVGGPRPEGQGHVPLEPEGVVGVFALGHAGEGGLVVSLEGIVEPVRQVVVEPLLPGHRQVAHVAFLHRLDEERNVGDAARLVQKAVNRVEEIGAPYLNRPVAPVGETDPGRHRHGVEPGCAFSIERLQAGKAGVAGVGREKAANELEAASAFSRPEANRRPPSHGSDGRRTPSGP